MLFNAGGSTDPDNDPLTYAWTFGDGQSGTGITASRTYTSTGSKTVTLTVSDGTTTAQTTRTVDAVGRYDGGDALARGHSQQRRQPHQPHGADPHHRAGR